MYKRQEGGLAVRLDKYLKVSRIVKRRALAQQLCDGGHVTKNGRTAKPSTNVDAVSYTHLDVYKRQMERCMYTVHLP